VREVVVFFFHFFTLVGLESEALPPLFGCKHADSLYADFFEVVSFFSMKNNEKSKIYCPSLTQLT